MPRPCITGHGKKPKMYRRTAIAYAHSKVLLDYIAEGHDLNDTILRFYGKLDSKTTRSKNKQINKWFKCEVKIRETCESGRGSHLNARQLGDATVVPKPAEQQIVLWINTLRKERSSRVQINVTLAG
ncbi:hypothetical protein PC116_g26764 [Phytophthora cactorum]|uniref:HTH CENPB-type domain-containing protein n=2 Tax=Phytophthora cactorum TaxID=29920 RepID=A0A329RJF2_9STRA|nr:hypothetical protein Pcac1_g15189 [Phytophthora cactorum]KAG2794231.1 hypothetical protein PC112_g23119 [Phytophthora cactorum]KAG2813378.1 hypothetical protein PC111_g14424 [Phytophthora cactorum]KAG2817742.1 hypothetical protein PC113_g22936 [Phytophthora cactorum]KAG2873671.1 hypothetical protein PC114_g25725 [Phytophthora cactorum]